MKSREQREFGHLNIQGWLTIDELAGVTRAVRIAGSTASKPGTILRQYIQLTLPLVDSLLKVEPLQGTTADKITLLRDVYRIQSEQLESTNLPKNVLKALVQESQEDGRIVNPFRQKLADPLAMSKVEKLLNENLSKVKEESDET